MIAVVEHLLLLFHLCLLRPRFFLLQDLAGQVGRLCGLALSREMFLETQEAKVTDQFGAFGEGIGARELCVREESVPEVVQLVEGPEEVPVV